LFLRGQYEGLVTGDNKNDSLIVKLLLFKDRKTIRCLVVAFDKIMICPIGQYEGLISGDNKNVHLNDRTGIFLKIEKRQAFGYRP